MNWNVQQKTVHKINSVVAPQILQADGESGFIGSASVFVYGFVVVILSSLPWVI